MFEKNSPSGLRAKPSVEPILGLEQSYADLPRMAAQASSDLVFILWEHSPSRVPLAEARLRAALAAKPGCERVCILFENCVEGSEKRRLEDLVRDFLSGSIDIEAGNESSGSSTLLGAVRAVHSIQRDTGIEIDFRFIDIEDPALCDASHAAISRRDEARAEIQSLKELRQERLISRFGTPENLLVHLRDCMRELVERQRDAIGAIRNDTMCSQIEAARGEVPEETPVIVMIGSAHAEVAAHFCRRPGFAFENVSLPEEFLAAAPGSYRFAYPGPSFEAEAIREPGRRTTSDGALVFEWMVAESLYELGACARESFDSRTRFLADPRVCNVLARAFCGTLPETVVVAEMEALASRLFEGLDSADETRFAIWRQISGVLERELGVEVSSLEGIPALHRAIFDRLIAVERG